MIRQVPGVHEETLDVAKHRLLATAAQGVDNVVDGLAEK
jgi:hypothetical protein